MATAEAQVNVNTNLQKQDLSNLVSVQEYEPKIPPPKRWQCTRLRRLFRRCILKQRGALSQSGHFYMK